MLDVTGDNFEHQRVARNGLVSVTCGNHRSFFLFDYKRHWIKWGTELVGLWLLDSNCISQLDIAFSHLAFGQHMPLSSFSALRLSLQGSSVSQQLFVGGLVASLLAEWS